MEYFWWHTFVWEKKYGSAFILISNVIFILFSDMIKKLLETYNASQDILSIILIQSAVICSVGGEGEGEGADLLPTDQLFQGPKL